MRRFKELESPLTFVIDKVLVSPVSRHNAVIANVRDEQNMLRFLVKLLLLLKHTKSCAFGDQCDKGTGRDN
ncbi:hypothetical protein BRARA_G01756 [Brassica rapa]|uniref:Uncharacterized protein n=1 Tax=Brassica campestris TaxID=3711 RepID=A0A397YTX0_BRACM|nr:hypothetical protein BRARA_G01756 [Brassica rapa]